MPSLLSPEGTPAGDYRTVTNTYIGYNEDGSVSVLPEQRARSTSTNSKLLDLRLSGSAFRAAARLFACANPLFPADTIRQVVVDESRRLQVGIADRRAEEFEPSPFHVFAHRIGLG